MMTKKELIDFLVVSGYTSKLIRKIKYVGVNYKGEDIFEFTHVGRTILKDMITISDIRMKRKIVLNICVKNIVPIFLNLS